MPAIERFSLLRCLHTVRPPFLLLVPSCLSLSWAWAYAQGLSVDTLDLALLLLGALAAHAAVNCLNELHDFRSGLDARTQRTPFSGGSGTLPASPCLERPTRWLAGLCLLVTIGTGSYFLTQGGWALLPIGLVGMGLIVFYTDQLTRRPLLCLLAPGLGFGLLLVNGGYLALTGDLDARLAWLSFLPACLVSNLLLMNQFPDIEADRSVGRRHLLIEKGPHAGLKYFAALQSLAWLPVLQGLLSGWLYTGSMLVLLLLPLAYLSARGLIRHYDNIPALLPYMALHVGCTLAAPPLLAVGLLL